METKEDLGIVLSDHVGNSSDVARMLDEIRERYIKMELLLNGSEESGFYIDGAEVLDRMLLLKNLRDSFFKDAQKADLKEENVA
jgi:transcriptional antiterminator